MHPLALTKEAMEEDHKQVLTHVSILVIHNGNLLHNLYMFSISTYPQNLFFLPSSPAKSSCKSTDNDGPNENHFHNCARI